MSGWCVMGNHDGCPDSADDTGVCSCPCHVAKPAPLARTSCLSYTPLVCKGPVEYHAIGDGRAFPRCEKHWRLRLDAYNSSPTERWANSSVPPPGFDPADAGESWDET